MQLFEVRSLARSGEIYFWGALETTKLYFALVKTKAISPRQRNNYLLCSTKKLDKRIFRHQLCAARGSFRRNVQLTA
jgi:hypothetical protein